MKKFRLFFKGSPKENEFLRQQKDNGYRLTSIHLGVYSFEKNAKVKNEQLQAEIVDYNFIPDNDDMIKKTVEKKLAVRPYKILYTYVEADDDKPIEVLNDTNDAEATYLKRLDNRIFLLSILIMLASVIAYILLVISDFPDTLAVLGIILAVVLYYTHAYKIAKRLDSVTPDRDDNVRPELTITLKNLPIKPDITALDYLGQWRYITSKKGEHYYRLKSLYSQTRIKEEIIAYLNIAPESLSIVDSMGLWPIGW